MKEIERKLADPEIYQGSTEGVAALQSALVEAHAEAEQLTARWEELEAKKAVSTA